MKKLFALVSFFSVILSLCVSSLAINNNVRVENNVIPKLNSVTENIDTVPLGYYFLYENNKKIAYVKDGEITEFSAPENILYLWMMNEYGLEFCTAFTMDNEIYLIYPDGNTELFADDAYVNEYGDVPFGVNRYGIIYTTIDGIRVFKNFTGENLTIEYSDYLINTAVSPNGLQFVYGAKNKHNYAIHTAVPVNGKNEFDTGEDCAWMICAFDNGAFYYGTDDKSQSVLYYVGENGRKEICKNNDELSDLQVGDVYYNKAGDQALIDDTHIICTLDHDGNFKVIVQLLDPNREFVDVADGTLSGDIAGNEIDDFQRLTTEEDFDTLYFYKYSLNDNNDSIDYILYYYKNGISRYVLSSYYKPQIYENHILYTGKDGTYRAYLSDGKIINSRKISDEKGDIYFGISGKNGYIENDKFIYYTENGKTEKVCDSEQFSIRRTDDSGEFAYISGVLYNKAEQIFSLTDAYYPYSTLKSTAVHRTYIQGDFLLYEKHDDALYIWTPESGESLLFNNLGWTMAI